MSICFSFCVDSPSTRLVLPFDPTIPRIEIDDLELVYVETLLDVMNLLAGQQLLPLLPEVELIEESKVTSRDFNQIIGHGFAKHALEIAPRGGH